MIKLLIADDHAIVREGIKKILALARDIKVNAEAVDALEVMEQLERRHDYDLLLLDLSMPGVAGTSLITQIKVSYPALPILIFSMHNEAQVASRVIKAGASGFIAKDSDPEILLEAIRRVANGGNFIDPALAEQMAFDALMPSQRAPHAMLSNREFEIFALLVAGKRVNDIAEILNISNKTVSTHKLNLSTKMKLRSTADLVHYAVEHQLFTQ
ncbi:MAG: response regulator transcription factor [Nitrosomonadales bacterium]|jgi:DNA-binding NarL/FixJ family response regulator